MPSSTLKNFLGSAFLPVVGRKVYQPSRFFPLNREIQPPSSAGAVATNKGHKSKMTTTVVKTLIVTTTSERIGPLFVASLLGPPRPTPPRKCFLRGRNTPHAGKRTCRARTHLFPARVACPPRAPCIHRCQETQRRYCCDRE